MDISQLQRSGVYIVVLLEIIYALVTLFWYRGKIR